MHNSVVTRTPLFEFWLFSF